MMLNQVILVGRMSSVNKLEVGYKITLTTTKGNTSQELIDVNVVINEVLAQKILNAGFKVGSTIGIKGSLNEKNEVNAERLTMISVNKEQSL
ncbi:hypothetical protein KHQ81_15430 (plasmid) [Mycoplasmatota bacterium]|nr:hypothetical protein KHQ81_15430 [Mycoplasmatota bacterium]